MLKVDFKPEHGMKLMNNVAQDVPGEIIGNLNYRKFKELTESGHAFSGFFNGSPLVCAGVMQVWTGRWYIWGMLSPHISHAQMLWIHRKALVWLDEMQASDGFRRIEATARASESHAQRWLEMLGFICEGKLRCYDADGNDHVLYARIACPLTQRKQVPSAPSQLRLRHC